MSSFLEQLDHLHHRTRTYDFSTTAILSYAIVSIFLLHQILYQFDIASLSLHDAVWNTFVYLTPTPLVLDAQQRKELGSQALWSQTHAAKSEAMRKALGVSGQLIMQQVPGAASITRRLSMARNGAVLARSNAPAGLGNWDNSCYQNSVLQGLTSLSALEGFLDRWSHDQDISEPNTLDALRETTAKLRDPSNNGSHIWTPAKLKSMSSWQQQDAQEYFSKIMDELDKDLSKIQKATGAMDGLEAAGMDRTFTADENAGSFPHNPLEGLLSQRVACTACGFSEGLSMIPFNCLTVPLGQGDSYSLPECLNEYTKLEPITGVECAKCTLLKAQRDLRRMTRTPEEVTDQVKTLLQLPPELRAQAMQRLQEVERALDEDDFSDETLKQKCQIDKRNRVTSTKTRQALIGRAPESLIIHVNRSVFHELTGMQSKNYAVVQYPAVLDLGPWILGSDGESAAGLLREGLWKYIYRLKAIVTHYGRHENGHYIAYRQSAGASRDEQHWWQLSDDDVSPSSDEDVLNQGGVFMLFYERMYDLGEPRTSASLQADTPLQVDSDDKMLIDSVVLNESGMWPLEHDASTETVTMPLQHDTSTDTVTMPLKHEDIGRLIASRHETEQTALKQDDLPEADIAVSEASTTEDEHEQELPQPVVRVASPASPFKMRTANDDINQDHWNPGRFVAAT